MRHKDYQALKEIQPLWQEIIAKMMVHFSWIEEKFGPHVKHDGFISALLQIAKNVQKYPHRSKYHLGIVRSDYMFDALRDKWEQVCVASILLLRL